MPDSLPHQAAARNPARSRARKAVWTHTLAIVTSLAAGAAGTVTVLDSWQKVLVDLGLRRDPQIVLAEQSARGDVTRQVVHMIAQRDFWTQRYVGDVSAGFPQADQDQAWQRYNDSVIAWNENYIPAEFLVRQYFKPDVDKQLRDINWLLRAVNGCVNQIHYRSLYEQDHSEACQVDGNAGGTQAENVTAVIKAVTDIDNRFATFLDQLSQ